MSNNLSFEQDLASGVVGIVFLALLVLLAFFALWIAIPLAVLFVIYKIYHLYQNSDTVQERKAQEHTHDLYQRALGITSQVPSRDDFIAQVCQGLPENLPDDFIYAVMQASLDLYDAEEFLRPLQKPPPICNTIEGARYRDYLIEYTNKIYDPEIPRVAVETIIRSNDRLLSFLPSFDDDSDAFATVPLSYLVSDLGQAVDS